MHAANSQLQPLLFNFIKGGLVRVSSGLASSWCISRGVLSLLLFRVHMVLVE